LNSVTAHCRPGQGEEAFDGFCENHLFLRQPPHQVLLGEPLVDGHGVRRFGGHSLRVLGARNLDVMGINLMLIQLMARWSSDVVLRYVADAQALGGVQKWVRCQVSDR
jgi:hypothetical protein